MGVASKGALLGPRRVHDNAVRGEESASSREKEEERARTSVKYIPVAVEPSHSVAIINSQALASILSFFHSFILSRVHIIFHSAL